MMKRCHGLKERSSRGAMNHTITLIIIWGASTWPRRCTVKLAIILRLPSAYALNIYLPAKPSNKCVEKLNSDPRPHYAVTPAVSPEPPGRGGSRVASPAGDSYHGRNGGR